MSLGSLQKADLLRKVAHSSLLRQKREMEGGGAVAAHCLRVAIPTRDTCKYVLVLKILKKRSSSYCPYQKYDPPGVQWVTAWNLYRRNVENYEARQKEGVGQTQCYQENDPFSPPVSHWGGHRHLWACC